MTKVLWADFKSDLSDTRQHWHISFRYGWYISKCYRWYISFRYDWHNSFRCRWHIDSVAIISTETIDKTIAIIEENIGRCQPIFNGIHVKRNCKKYW